MIIFDEKKYAEAMLKRGFSTKNKNVYELNILAKYYFYIGKSKQEVKELIITFCEKYIDYFNMDEWYGIINRTISSASRGKLTTGKSVEITKAELETIQQLSNIKEQKLAFTMLVLYKFYDCRKFKVTLKDLFELSDLTTINTDTKLKLLHSLTSQELIDIDMRGRRWVKFNDENSNVKIVISNFENFIYEYLKFTGETISNCKLCNKAFKTPGKIQASNPKKYCEECAIEQKRRSKRRWKNRSRKNKN